MATNTGEGYRKGAVKERTQIRDGSGHWNKRDRATGEFMDQKADTEPFKGVAKEPDRRQDH